MKSYYARYTMRDAMNFCEQLNNKAVDVNIGLCDQLKCYASKKETG